MDMTTIFVLLLAALMTVLSFLALIKSKVYINEQTNTPTSVDLPILGKISTNYPALIFVMLACALAFYAVKTNADVQQQNAQIQKELALAQDDEWVVTGQILAPPGASRDIDLRNGTVEAVPAFPAVSIDRTGKFELRVKLRHGDDFEKSIGLIDYTNLELGSAQIIPAEELQAFQKDPSKSHLASMTPLSRSYKAVLIGGGQ
ncbi:MAG TPA: hypothetical protein VFI49_14530 [Rudaea sp.]|nr:hypothetical protein [Rudaea sp.]